MKVLGLIICTALFLCQHLVYVQADVSASKYQKIGCYKDDWSRAIPTLEGQDSILDSDYWTRKDAIEKCYQAAKKKGFQIFAVQNGGQCFSSARASETFDKYGRSSTCKSDGEGGPWGNQVYYITVSATKYQKMGCFKDKRSRALPTLEGQDPILDGGYWTRKDPIEKCYQAAKKKGFQIFAVQNGGQCFSSATALNTFDKYGRSSNCKSDGKGGPYANQVYYITGTTTVPTAGPTTRPTAGSVTGPTCGQVSALSKRIVGGAHASPGEWPWHVQMHVHGDRNQHFCSGTLITPQWVITSAHCVVHDPSQIGLTLGELDLNAISGHEQTYGISKAIKHPDYSRFTLHYDFALMKLAKPATINKHVRTVCLPESIEKLPVDTVLWETGWGRTSHGGQQAEYLKELKVIVEDPKKSQYTVHSTMFITKTETAGHGTCRGDSGGPVVREENGRWILEGVHSWGRTECAIKGQYDGQADVRTVLPWIKDTMKNN